MPKTNKTIRLGRRQWVYAPTNSEKGYLLSPIEPDGGVKGDIGRAMRAKAIKASKLEKDSLGENESFKIITDIGGNAHVLFNTSSVSEANKIAEEISGNKNGISKGGIYVKAIEENVGYLSANTIPQVQKYLGFGTERKKILYNDAKADQILESARIQR